MKHDDEQSRNRRPRRNAVGILNRLLIEDSHGVTPWASIARVAPLVLVACLLATAFAEDENKSTPAAVPSPAPAKSGNQGLSKLQEAAPAKPATKETIESLSIKTNLLLNSSFEQGNADNTGPAHWSPIDGLVYQWTTDINAPGRGKVLKIDTDIYQRQAYAWWIEHFIHGKPLSDAPKKEETTGPKWDTIGGLDGGFYLSDFIPIKDGGAYMVMLDIKGPGCKVFVKGYTQKGKDKVPNNEFADENPAVKELFRKAKNDPLLDEKGRPIKYRLNYGYSFWFPAGGSNEWQTYTHESGKRPNGRDLTKDIKYIRVMLYPYWPATTYMFDNIRVVEVDPPADKAKLEADEADLDQGKVVR